VAILLKTERRGAETHITDCLTRSANDGRKQKLAVLPLPQFAAAAAAAVAAGERAALFFRRISHVAEMRSAGCGGAPRNSPVKGALR
jgi:hypothetical protein